MMVVSGLGGDLRAPTNSSDGHVPDECQKGLFVMVPVISTGPSTNCCFVWSPECLGYEEELEIIPRPDEGTADFVWESPRIRGSNKHDCVIMLILGTTKKKPLNWKPPISPSSVTELSRSHFLLEALRAVSIGSGWPCTK